MESKTLIDIHSLRIFNKIFEAIENPIYCKEQENKLRYGCYLDMIHILRAYAIPAINCESKDSYEKYICKSKHFKEYEIILTKFIEDVSIKYLITVCCEENKICKESYFECEKYCNSGILCNEFIQDFKERFRLCKELTCCVKILEKL